MSDLATAFVRKPRSLRTHLVSLCLALSLPGVLFTGTMLFNYADKSRQQIERQGLDAVREISFDLETDIKALTATLTTLATSTRLPTGEMDVFQMLSSRVAQNVGLPIVLTDLQGQQLTNTRVPYGTPLPAVTTSYAKTIETKQPTVSDLFTGAVARSWIYSIAVPVFRPETDNVTHVLNFSIDPHRIRDILVRNLTQEGAIAAVIDKDGRIMARSVGHERLVGAIPEAFNAETKGKNEGQFRHTNLDGVEIVASFTRMKSTGWVVAYGVPAKLVQQPIETLWLQLSGISLLVGLAATGSAWLFAGRITSSLARLQESTKVLASGRPVEPVQTPIHEVNVLSKALVLASSDLRDAIMAKDTLLYEINHRVKNSLHVVTSMLSLHAKQAPTEETRESLLQLRTRIDVIARLHQRLYADDRHDKVDISTFLRELTLGTLQALSDASSCHVDFDCEDGIILPIGRATPLSLIVGELLTNAVKHGRRPDATWHICVKVRRADQKRIAVTVTDDGPGLPHDFDMNGMAGLGMTIVKGLVRQLRGTLQLHNEAGLTGFTITIDQERTG